MYFASIPQLPTVDTLPDAGEQGRIVVLSSDGHLYYDNGSDWEDLNENTAFRLYLLETNFRKLLKAFVLGGLGSIPAGLETEFAKSLGE